MIKKLLKTLDFCKTETSNQKESEPQVLSDNYPAEVIEIHNAFNNEAELLLKQAIEASNKIVIDKSIKNKVDLASKFGFFSIKEVKEIEVLESEKAKHDELLDAITKAKEYIPDYNWIPGSSVLRIREQYNLIFGKVNQYTGFLPNKNLLEIEKFANKYKSKLFGVRKEYMWGENNIRFYPTEMEANNNVSSGYYGYSGLYNSLNNLMICAPLKDMGGSDNHTIEKGYKLEKKAIPDPIVLARRDFNDIIGYYIVTAWGNEVTDN